MFVPVLKVVLSRMKNKAVYPLQLDPPYPLVRSAAPSATAALAQAVDLLEKCVYRLDLSEVM